MTKETPWDIDYRVYRARADIVALSWAMKRSEATEEQFDEALAPLAALLTTDRFHPEYYQKISEIHMLKAKWLLSQKKSPEGTIARGLEMADKALSIHPRMATALETKGQLFAVRARLRGPAHLEAEEQANAAFRAAIKLNPLLEIEERVQIQ
ncbi:MAG TPA: hypothetical protein PK156_49110 [Polyangium sp.]|nr:hypothetical protein [Polyangium sp.]